MLSELRSFQNKAGKSIAPQCSMPIEWGTTGMNVFELNYEWRPFESNPGEEYTYPSQVTAYLRNNYTSAVYRWAIYRERPDRDSFFVGQCKNLSERLLLYLPFSRGREPETKRVRDVLRNERRKGSIIKLQWLWFEDFNIISKEYKGEGTLISPRGMHFDHVRTMMEGFALAVQDHVHGEILNCVSGPIERRIR